MITIYSKRTCGPCQALKQFINSLDVECQSKVTIISDETVTLNELYKYMLEIGSNSFPTIVFDSGRIINGFGKATMDIIKDYLSC